MPDDSSPPPSFGPWQYLFRYLWVPPRHDGDWDLLAIPWRARPYRYSTAELADFQAKMNGAILSMLMVLAILLAPGILTFDLWLSGKSMSLGGATVTPGLAGIIAFGILPILIGSFIYFSRRIRPMKLHPRTEAVPLRERWPLIEWAMLDFNR